MIDFLLAALATILALWLSVGLTGFCMIALEVKRQIGTFSTPKSSGDMLACLLMMLKWGIFAPAIAAIVISDMRKEGKR